jgi:integrase
VALYRRPNSPHYWVRFQLNGREVRLSSGTENRRAAEEFEAKARSNAWRQVKLGERPAYPWATARARWLAETQKRTKEKDEIILTWFDEHLKGAHVQTITREVIEELRALKRDETSPATADRYMALLRAILKKCVDDWQVLESAPKVPMYRVKPAEPRWLTRPEFERLCKELPEHLALAARLAAFTGLRMRSMLGLTWDRVDLKARRAWIPASGMKGARTHGVPLSAEAINVLRWLKALNFITRRKVLKSRARRGKDELPPDCGRVFQHDCKPIDDCNTKAFQDAVERSGVGPLHWHSLRHTFASWAVRNGVTLHELMQLGGWASYSMVLRYGHLAPDHLAEAAEKVRNFSHNNRHTGKQEKISRLSA